MLSRVCLVLICIASIFTVSARAQSQRTAAKPDTVSFLIFNNVTVGPYFTAGVSRMNENIPEGWHSAPRFAYTFGGLGFLDINSWLGFSLGAYYDTRDLYLAMPEDSVSADLGLSYLSIQPSIRIFWLLIGLALDIPMSGNATESIAHFSHLGLNDPYLQNRNIETNDMAPLTEVRASLSVPLVQLESGLVKLEVSGSYPLSKTIQGTASFDSTGYYSKVGEGPLPTVQAGLSFQFDLLH